MLKLITDGELDEKCIDRLCHNLSEKFKLLKEAEFKTGNENVKYIVLFRLKASLKRENDHLKKAELEVQKTQHAIKSVKADKIDEQTASHRDVNNYLKINRKSEICRYLDRRKKVHKELNDLNDLSAIKRLLTHPNTTTNMLRLMLDIKLNLAKFADKEEETTEHTASQKTIAKIVKEWVNHSKYTQSELASILKVSQPVLNSQLNGQKPIPIDRIKQLAIELQPSDEDVNMIRTLLAKSATEKLDFI